MTSKKWKLDAYLTVFLTLILGVLLPFCFLLMDGVRQNAVMLEASCVSQGCIHSVMAEYHRELLEQYNLFAIDSSYGTGNSGREYVEYHLKGYLEKNLPNQRKGFFRLRPVGVELKKISLLTDDQGAVFYRRAAEAIRDDLGLETVEHVKEWMETVTIQGMADESLWQDKEDMDREIEEYEIPEELGELENPTRHMNFLPGNSLLELVMPEGTLVSNLYLNSENLLERRMERGEINKGNMEETSFDFWQRIYFQGYLLKYYGRFGQEKENGSLSYQIEYLLNGSERDEENLEKTLEKICLLREVDNFRCIKLQEEKCLEAERVAMLICIPLSVPELIPLLTNSILLGWAYAESLNDLKILMDGGKVALLKSKDDWSLSLEEALIGKLGQKKEQDGLEYEDYLRILLGLSSQKTLCRRGMTILEADIRKTEGNQRFRLDGCVDRMEAQIWIACDGMDTLEVTRYAGY